MPFEEHCALPDGFGDILQDCARALGKLKRHIPDDRTACELSRIEMRLWSMSEFPHPVE
jgi:hypothetical protein